MNKNIVVKNLDNTVDNVDDLMYLDDDKDNEWMNIVDVIVDNAFQ